MSSVPSAPGSLSVTDAARDAVERVKSQLFPFQFDRWIALGLVAFLDQCGRTGNSSGNFRVPGGGGGGSPGGGGGGEPDFSAAKEWIAAHLLLIVGIAAAVLLLVVALTAVVLWLNSRGVFMYIDNVASGRSDVVRPWREHKARAASYFAWSFAASLAGMVVVLVLLVPIGWAIFALLTDGFSVSATAVIVLAVLLLMLFGLVMSLFLLVLRDFAAPLQIRLQVPCGEALRAAFAMVRGSPGGFVAYVALKIAFAIGTGVAATFLGCCTCCLGFLPVIMQTALQPLFYFERAWSLFILRRAGYDLFPAAAAAPAPGFTTRPLG